MSWPHAPRLHRISVVRHETPNAVVVPPVVPVIAVRTIPPPEQYKIASRAWPRPT